MALSWRGFYAIVDPDVCAGDPLAVADAFLRGGCAALQLRHKSAADPADQGKKSAAVPADQGNKSAPDPADSVEKSTDDRSRSAGSIAGDRATLALARALSAKCRAARVPFVMNDRLDLALLADADGLHLGQDDLPIAEARRFFRGPIGVSTHDLAQLTRAIADGADLVGFGPVFATSTKKNPDPVVGLDGLAAACRAATVPVVAIGGIDRERARACFGVGAALVAAIGATCAADDPEAAARALHEVAA
jgi:thiamine-phosphate pyrophosphorylase